MQEPAADSPQQAASGQDSATPPATAEGADSAESGSATSPPAGEAGSEAAREAGGEVAAGAGDASTEAGAQAAASAAESVPAPAAEPVSELGLPAWVPEPVQGLWEAIAPLPWLQALLILVVFFFVAKVVEHLSHFVTSRLSARTATDIDDRLFALLRQPIFLSVFFLGLGLSARALVGGLELPVGVYSGLIKVLKTILVLVWLSAGMKVAGVILEALGRHHDRFPLVEERTIPLFNITCNLLIFGGFTYLLLAIWGIDPSAWLASAGILGIAVGFAAKDTLANLFSGFFILADAPYKIGDYIVLGSGERGRVMHVGMRSTRLLTRDDVEITVPNAVMANAKIINESGGPWEKERVRVKVGVAYGSDLDQVCSVLKQVAIDHSEVCADPAPRVRMRAFGDSSLDFELLCWIDEPELRGRLLHELLMAVYKALQAADIEIPYPKRDVYLYRADGSGDEV